MVAGQHRPHRDRHRLLDDALDDHARRGGRAPRPVRRDDPQAPCRRLRGDHRAEGVRRPGRRTLDAAGVHRRGRRPQRQHRVLRIDHRHGRARVAVLRHRGAEADPRAGPGVGRGELVPALQRARRRQRSRRTGGPRRTRRRRVRHQRSEGLELGGHVRATWGSCSCAPTPTP